MEIRKSAKSVTLKFAYEKGHNRIGELVRGCLADVAEQLPGKILKGVMNEVIKGGAIQSINGR